MTSIPSLPCLFCKHPNPAGAIFCNVCGTQLNMQPCDRCGAIDARDARNCYKCGGEFPVLDALEPAPLPEVPPLDTLAHAPDGTDPVAWSPGPVSQDTGALPLNTAVSARKRRWTTAAVTLSLALIAGASLFYFNRGRPELITQQPVLKQPLSPAQVKPLPAQATEPGVASTCTTPLAEPASRSGDAGIAAPAPSVADVKGGNNSLASNDCPHAVATLGLCSSQPKPGTRP